MSTLTWQFSSFIWKLQHLGLIIFQTAILNVITSHARAIHDAELVHILAQKTQILSSLSKLC